MTSKTTITIGTELQTSSFSLKLQVRDFEMADNDVKGLKRTYKKICNDFNKGI